MDLVDRLCLRAADTPDQVLFVELLDGVNESARLTAGQLRDRAATLAGALRDAGVCPGDVVLMIATPPCEFLVALLGCLWAGVIPAPISFPRRVEHLTSRLEPVRANAGAVAVVAAPANEPAERKVLEALTEGSLPVISTQADAAPMTAPVADRDVAYLQYTSGSTSEPRGVVVRHANLTANLDVIAGLEHLDSSCVNVSWCPLTHDMGIVMGALPSIHLGMTSVLMPPSAFIRHPLRWMQAMSTYRGTHGYSPNFGYDLLVERSTHEERAKLDLSSVRVLINGAEPVRRHTGERFTEAFAVSGLPPTAHSPAYGLAEAVVLVSATPPAEHGRVVTVDADALEHHAIVEREVNAAGETRELCHDGVFGHSYDARIVDPETCEELAPGRVGELWLRGPSICEGYWRRAEMSAETFGARLAGDEGPFLRTGDLAFVRDGELVICGRAKDLIIIHGRNLYPQDIEMVAELAHDAVRAGGSAAFAVDDGAQEGLVIVAEVSGEPDGDEVAAAVGAAVQCEFELHVHDVLLVAPFTVPKTSSGKKQRAASRRLWAAARGVEALATR